MIMHTITLIILLIRVMPSTTHTMRIMRITAYAYDYAYHYSAYSDYYAYDYADYAYYGYN